MSSSASSPLAPGPSHAPGEPASAAGRQRLALIDTLRGIGIVVVVIGHVAAGLNAAGLLEAAPVLRGVTTSAYSVHMPLFALLSGLFVAASVERSGRWRSLRQRALMLAYLFVVWTIIQGAAELATNGVRNATTTPIDLFRVWEPIAHLWFLPWLLAVTAIAVVARPWRRGALAVLVLVLAVVVSLVFWGVEGPAVWQRGLGLIAFFMAGAALTARGLLEVLARIPLLVRALGGIVAIVAWAALAWGTPLTVATSNDPDRDAGSIALGVAAAVCGIVAVLLLVSAAVPPASTRRNVVATIGRSSMAIYLGHIIVSAGVRVLLTRVGVDEPVTLFVISTVLGVAVPMLVERVPFVGRVLFTWPFARNSANGDRGRA